MDRPVMSYYCGRCNLQIESSGIPYGWVLVRQNITGKNGELLTVTICCSLVCTAIFLFNRLFKLERIDMKRRAIIHTNNDVNNND